jgi:ankyrin repeat protein
VRRTLDELPESLDETYERVLKEIKKPNRDHALRVLQCLVVAIRPLRVEELAEVLAVDFGNEEGIPNLNPNWRWEEQEQALLTSCSSLIAIVEANESRIVQFSHFSVKEFLTSDRLGTSSGGMSRYHVLFEPAHTILAQACMSILLRLDDDIEESGVRNRSPLAGYAAEHWVAHAQYGQVSSRLRKAMEFLFDVDKPHFTAWLQLHDLDTETHDGNTFYVFTSYSKSGTTPLYYAALCGFQDLVEHLIFNCPKQVNAEGGYYLTPLVAALAGEHFQTAKLLHDNGADPNVRGHGERTLLHSAALCGEFEIVQVLLKYKADVNARMYDGGIPLHSASEGTTDRGPNIGLSLSHIARLLLEHGADVNARRYDHFTPLHTAAYCGTVEVVRVLLEHGADVNAREDDHSTPLHTAACHGTVEVVRVLLEHGADVNAREDDHSTSLHTAAYYGTVEVVRVLLEHGADAEDSHGRTALQVASDEGDDDIMELLSEHGATR